MLARSADMGSKREVVRYPFVAAARGQTSAAWVMFAWDGDLGLQSWDPRVWWACNCWEGAVNSLADSCEMGVLAERGLVKRRVPVGEGAFPGERGKASAWVACEEQPLAAGRLRVAYRSCRGLRVVACEEGRCSARVGTVPWLGIGWESFAVWEVPPCDYPETKECGTSKDSEIPKADAHSSLLGKSRLEFGATRLGLLLVGQKELLAELGERKVLFVEPEFQWVVALWQEWLQLLERDRQLRPG